MDSFLPKTLQQPFKGILFDLDGTIIDSEELHYTAWKQALREYGYDPDSLGETVPYQGNFKKMYTEIAAKLKLPEDLFDQIYERKVEITVGEPATNLNLLEGITSFLELMQERRVPMGIVTNSEADYANHMLDGYDFRHYFEHVVHADHAVAPKPAPDGYLYGASLLDLQPEDILVFENTDVGIQAAKAAGMKVIAIRSTDWLGVSTYEQADFVIDHFADSALDDLEFTPNVRS